MASGAVSASRTAGLVTAGILLMLLADFLFALNDAMGKWLVASFSVGQLLLVRSVGAFVVLSPMLARQPAAALLRPAQPGLQLLRVVLATADTALFYAAVVYLPLADVMTFYMAGPIWVAAMSHFCLGERVGWRRWLAIGVGFVGVLVILRPSSASLSPASLFALLGSLSFSAALVLNRVLRDTSDAVLVGWQTAGAFLTGAVWCLWTWRTPDALGFGSLLLLGVVACCGHLLIARSLKLAPASTLAPLQYTLLLWGVVFGYAFFGDVPGVRMLVGSAIIVVAGLFIFHRQAVVAEVPEEAVKVPLV
ncbi:DMT family transporter [Aurantimonas sp. MSK8Z-1]|uniref:DMT family transporter n=1 Tax=Mangrovibrevibacter kandeliae TaxID=2968473 RepID=UPI00211962D0|nr:DMT family transporter [Aurantimonas sp. MSK8Z-1]MCW4116500.1 DMT family transporter [Aurantimonas sp. MSK8Z-1]